MKTMFLRIFQREVERQCKFALLAVEDLNQAFKVHDSDRIWYSIQSFLVAAGNVSKLLWPPKQGSRKRGEILRNSLGVAANSPLEPRILRNHFEHFDERLESWATISGRVNFADSNVGPLSGITGLDPSDYLRNFDPVTMTITFHGDEYDVEPVVEAISVLWHKAQTEAQKTH